MFTSVLCVFSLSEVSQKKIHFAIPLPLLDALRSHFAILPFQPLRFPGRVKFTGFLPAIGWPGNGGPHATKQNAAQVDSKEWQRSGKANSFGHGRAGQGSVVFTLATKRNAPRVNCVRQR